jgi:hypothetical protein
MAVPRLPTWMVALTVRGRAGGSRARKRLGSGVASPRGSTLAEGVTIDIEREPVRGGFSGNGSKVCQEVVQEAI